MLNKILLTLLVSWPFLTFGESYTTILEKGKLPVLTPAFKERKTAKIRLENGLEAYLISDPRAELSGAMLSVKVGSWEDPKEYPGLAHFLEHMLFLGTKKYPKESEYTQFIIEHGGQTNAFTTSNTTNYLFTVRSGAFQEAFVRFASFFEEPILNPSGVSRELKAIDQEYAKNRENDTIRQMYVIKELVQADHPFHNFNMGNSLTLSQVSRKTLLEWYQEHYSANLMRLVVYSSLPIDHLKQLVVDELQHVPSSARNAFSINKPALPESLEGKFVYIEPIKDTRILTILWELPPKFAHMEDKRPDRIISFVLGHEGEKSLLAQLKREQLAEAVSCEGIKLGDNLFLFYLQVELTTEGLKDIDHVAARCFQAIKQVQQRGIPKSLFDEIQTMDRIAYQYRSRENEFLTLMEHGYAIQDEDMTTYPEKTEVLQEFDSAAIQEMLTSLTPEKARFLILAPSKHTLVKPELKEKWLGVEYAIKPLSKEFTSKWKTQDLHPAIDLPPTNPYIPHDLNIVNPRQAPQIKELPFPKLLLNDSLSTFYFAQDTYFGIPKISWIIQVKTPQVSLADPLKTVMADLYVRFVEDALSKASYPAKMAGLNFTIKRENNGIQIELEGYSENAYRLFEEMIKQMTTLEPTVEKFKIFKDSLARQYQNFGKESPLDQSLELFKSILYQEYVSENEKATALRKVTFNGFCDWYTELFTKTFLEGIFYGNVTEEQARQAIGVARTAFYHGVYPKVEQPKNKVLVLPNKEGPYYLESQTKSQGNAVLLAIENSQFSFQERGAQQILMQAIEEPFFSALRTKQQTGYLVHSFGEEVERKLFNFFAVQSNTHDTRDLLSRFETFIEAFLQEMGQTEVTKEQFDRIKSSLIKSLEEPARNIKEMGQLLNLIAFQYEGDFSWIRQRIEGLKALSYEEFLAIAKQFLGRQNKRRLAILLKGEIPRENIFFYTKASTWNLIRKISDYQAKDPKRLSLN